MFLKNVTGQVKELHDSDDKTANFLINTGRWKKVEDRKDSKVFLYNEDVARGLTKTSQKKYKKKTKK